MTEDRSALSPQREKEKEKDLARMAQTRLASTPDSTAGVNELIRRLTYGDVPLVLLARDSDGDVMAYDLQRSGCMCHADDERSALEHVFEARRDYDAAVQQMETQMSTPESASAAPSLERLREQTRLVKPPKNFSPPHPWQTCPCDVCATRREFQQCRD